MFGKTRAANPRQPETETKVLSAQADDSAAQIPRHRQHSYLSKDAKLKGDFVSAGDVTIEGTLDGRIKCRSLTLSGEPVISGSIEADTVHVCGSFEGELHARKVVLAKTARLIGDVFQKSLEIHPGAIFEGQVARLDIQPSDGTRKPKANVAGSKPPSQSQPDSPSAP